ncbi:MAG: DUF4326 domain-containing protein [Chlamydiia bacterium]
MCRIALGLLLLFSVSCWDGKTSAPGPTQLVNVDRGEAFDVYIGRDKEWGADTRWGNPFHIGPDGTREEVIVKYRNWILQQPELLAALPMLEGKILGCHCKPEACHGDVLLELLKEARQTAGRASESN